MYKHIERAKIYSSLKALELKLYRNTAVHFHPARMLWYLLEKNSKTDFYTKIIHMERKLVKTVNECQHDADTSLTISWDWKEGK